MGYFLSQAGGGSWGDRQGPCTPQLHPEARVVFGPNSGFAFTLGKCRAIPNRDEGVGTAAATARESTAMIKEGGGKYEIVRLAQDGKCDHIGLVCAEGFPGAELRSEHLMGRSCIPITCDTVKP